MHLGPDLAIRPVTQPVLDHVAVLQGREHKPRFLSWYWGEDRERRSGGQAVFKV